MLFGRKPTFQPEPTDKIQPLHFFERSALLLRMNVAISLVVDEVLDPGILRTSLENVAKRPGWERLAGRVHKNSSGELEWHIPTHFPKERDIIGFTHVDHGMPAASHPAASLIPEATKVPTIVGDTDRFLDLVFEPGHSPGGIFDYLDSDKPLTSLRVNTFTDKTFLVLYWCHAAFDAMGIKYLVEAWIDSLWGREDHIPEPFGADADPFVPLTEGARPITETHVLANRRVSLAGLLQWGFKYGMDMLVRAPENQAMCIPYTAWEPQYDRAMDELRAEAKANGEDESKVFLTDNDVLTAGLMRCVVFAKTNGAAESTATVNLSLAMSLRKAFQGDLLPPAAENRPYVGNAFGWGSVIVTEGDVTSKPLSWLARQVRRAINEQGTRAQHEAYYDMVRKSGLGLPVIIFGDSNMTQIGMSNWHKANLMMLDFAPARKFPKKADAGHDKSPPCLPYYAQENHGPVTPTDVYLVLGKDSKGNYWISASRTKGTWPAFEAQLCEAYGVEE